jgi:hypothetical protein
LTLSDRASRIRAIRLEILSHIAAGLGLVAWGLLLVTRASRPRMYGRLGFFVLALGAGIAARAIYWSTGERLLAHVMLAAFGLFPLPLGLFFESLLQRHLHLVAKIALLTATLLFVGTAWTELAVDRPWWSLALIAYHSLAVAYFGGLTIAEWRRRPPGPRKSMYGATVVVCAVAVALMATDWTSLLGFHNPRLGAIPALAVLYFGGASLDAADEWRLRVSVQRLVAYVAAAALLAGLVWLALRPADGDAVLIIGGVLLFALVAFEPFRHVLARRRRERRTVLLDRLSHIPARSLEQVIATLQRWPEIEKTIHLRPDELQLASVPRVVEWMEGQGSVATLAEVDRALALSSSRDKLFVLEQVRHVMKSWGVEYLGLLGRDGALLGVSFTVGLDPTTYRRAFELIILISRLVSERVES